MKKELDLILKAIAEAREFTRKGHEVHVDISGNNGLCTIYPDRLIDILLILQDDEKILKIKESPEWTYRPDTMDLALAEVLSDMGGDFPIGYFTVEILESFDKWCANYWAKRENSFEKSVSISEQEEVQKAETVYSITYTKAREIFLNDVVNNSTHLLAKPSFDSENDNVFNYLYEHPDQKFTKKQIEDGVHITGVKSLHKIVENLGFQGDIKRVFFNVSEQSIKFRNSITRKDLKNLNIDRIKPPE